MGEGSVSAATGIEPTFGVDELNSADDRRASTGAGSSDCQSAVIVEGNSDGREVQAEAAKTDELMIPAVSDQHSGRNTALHGRSAATCYAAELCAGSGNYSAKLKKLGLNPLPVDHQFNQHRQRIQTVSLDLSKESGWIIMYELLRSGRLVYAHGAPPCGTSTRARDKRVPAHLVKAGAPDPKPLRSQQWPHGLPNLKGDAQKKVEQANKIYRRMALFFEECGKMNVAWSCENPARSYMWLTKWFVKLEKMTGVQSVYYDGCMHGGSRKKRSKWLTNVPELKKLERDCDDRHTHEPWGLFENSQGYAFYTALEAEYPDVLCERAAELVKEHLVSRGLEFKDSSPDAVGQPEAQQKKRAEAGKQPRGCKFPELIPEFHLVCDVQCYAEKGTFRKGDKLSNERATALGVEPGSKILSIDERLEDSGLMRVNLKIGIYHSEEQFIQKAMELLLGLMSPMPNGQCIKTLF